MDFSWVKDLAEQSNQKELARRERLRRQSERDKQVALATAPFVEKLHLVVSACAEEFNKFIQFPELRVTAGRVQKRLQRTVNENDPELAYPEEATSFGFSRCDWTYGIRGCRGEVEFIEVPTSGGALSVRLDEVGATPSRKFVAHLDEDGQQIVWKQDGQVMDGQAIMTICRDYFREFIERTNKSA